MLIACVQSDVSFADPPSNLTRVLSWMETAARSHAADLVVFPECMLSGYTFDSREQALDVALEIDDPIFDSLTQAAKTHGQFITLGFLEREVDLLFNSAAMIGPSGVVGCYRKIHLPRLGVDRFVDRGDRPYQPWPAQTPRAGEVNVGLAICYDSSFPEPMRVLGLGGADVIALGTNWPNEAIHTAAIVPPARSMENHLFCRRQSHRNRKRIRFLRQKLDLWTRRCDSGRQ